MNSEKLKIGELYSYNCKEPINDCLLWDQDNLSVKIIEEDWHKIRNGSVIMFLGRADSNDGLEWYGNLFLLENQVIFLGDPIVETKVKELQ